MTILDDCEKHTSSASQLTGGDDDFSRDGISMAQSPQEYNEGGYEFPFFSVLNVVVDHAMVRPTPLESQEFLEVKSNSRIRVPVLRIFGPIVRAGAAPTAMEQLQSACLFVHGAFPYMIARPIASGPDGSILRQPHSETPSDHIDWDSIKSVEKSVNEIQACLETTIQMSMEQFGNERQQHTASPRTRVIRRVSVVTGRGFYTYSPGPPAPFLRVEYYDPKLRWRVKLTLEKGLDLPLFYHPDPQHYNPQPSSPVDNDRIPLRFNCYEAHIPYTMQVFKDWNLAGMAYVHLSQGRFRHPMPRSYRSRVSMSSLMPSPRSEHLFLASNTDVEHKWRAPDQRQVVSTGRSQPPPALQQSPQTKGDQRRGTNEQSYSFDLKETSCDVEVDVSVEHIMNVRSIMTGVADEERDNVHWRAVPSLREIWRQERRRMSRLLKPQDDFLSQRSPLQESHLTLNVKTGASMPGAQLAVQGMKKLFAVSQDLEGEFQRCLRQIVKRHHHDVNRIDRLFIGQDKVEDDPKWPQGTQESEMNDSDAVDALALLGDQFDDSPAGKSSMSLSIVSSTPPSISQETNSSGRQDSCHLDETAEVFSQKVDRGDSIVELGESQNVEEYIDPKTLVPFEDDDEEDEEEEMSEQDFERTLHALATQGVQTNRHRQKQVVSDGFTTKPSIKTIDRGWSSPSNGSQPNGIPTSSDEKGGYESAPPTRQEVAESSHRYFQQTSQRTASWLRHCNSFESMRDRLVEKELSEVCRKVASATVPGFLRPSTMPPRRRKVESWCKRYHARKETKPGHRRTTDKLKAGACTDIKRDSPPVSRKRKMELEGAGFRRTKRMQGNGATKDHISKKVNFADESSQDSSGQIAPSSRERMASPRSTCTASSIEGEKLSDSRGAEQLVGIGQIGGRMYVEGGGGLKARSKVSLDSSPAARPENRGLAALELPSPLSILCVEVQVQCRSGRAGVNDSTEIAMRPNSDKDKIAAIVYVFALDPGGGESLRVLERGCLFVPVDNETKEANHELARCLRQSLPRETLGIESSLHVECVQSEKQLLLRLASIVRWKDPDMLVSWDTQGAGIGFIIERGAVLGAEQQHLQDACKPNAEVDMVRLLGRNPTALPKEGRLGSSTLKSIVGLPPKASTEVTESHRWEGSGLGAEWDERVGPGAAAASIDGRLVFSGWKLVAEEVKHPNVSYLPAMVSTLLNRRIPHHDDLLMTRWYGQENGRDRWRVVSHRLTQATACLLMFDALDLIGRAGEAARLSGVEFSQSFPGIRGSQYKVEGVLLRALKSIHSDERGSKRGFERSREDPLSLSSASNSQSPWKVCRGRGGYPELGTDDITNRRYFFYSPSVQDTNKQEALEVQALTLEPESGCQKDPVVVCDFTALYPSLIIAYNLCYTTCFGRLDYHTTRAEMQLEGRTTRKVGPFTVAERRTATVIHQHIKSVSATKDGDKAGDTGEDRAYVAPTGTMYVSEAVLKGVLPQVLDEILSTRAMIKKAAKLYKRLVPTLPTAVLRQLEARQLALKYIANVSYGYTSATFSGRCAMPLLADTIVECARRTLTNAINLANEWGRKPGGRWYGAKVIYGDTDSVFVQLPGRSVTEAFDFGEAFCKAVTDVNPPPVQLKLEKVYDGSIMQTKKKYCGMKYESRDQKEPTFEAKGIETIRRDQCALTQKVLRKALTTLFRGGLGACKSFLHRQWALILRGHMPVSDFILTGRVRSRYRGGRVGPVQAVLARRLAEADPGRMVRHKERLAYVIVATPGLTFRLKDCVLTPMELLERWDSYTIHTAYYITRHVNAALQRCLGLSPHFLDVNALFEACPKPRRRLHFWPVTRAGSSVMISSYFGSDTCSLCGRKCLANGTARAVVCQDCRRDTVRASIEGIARLKDSQNEAQRVASACGECNGFVEDSSTFAQFSDAENGGVGRKSAGLVPPLANCTCIDCPNTFERHRLKEKELESNAICKALDIF